MNYEPPPQRAKTIKSYTRERKLEVIAYLWNYRKYDVSWHSNPLAKVRCRRGQKWYDNEYRPPTYEEAASHFRIASINVRRWWETRNEIAAQKAGTRADHSLVQKERLPQIEYELFKLLNGLRDLGQSVTRKILTRRAKRLVFKYFPDVGFRFSNGWFTRFKKRWGISWRRKTKQSQLKPEEIQHYVNNWLCFFRRNNIKAELLPYVIDDPARSGLLCFSISLPCNSSITRFTSKVIINMDETPLPFEIASNTTYNIMGSQTICIKTARSGWDKRQATLVLWISADGDIFAPMLIFHGQGNITEDERAEYKRLAPEVFVEFNAKAWNNSELVVKQLNRDIRPRLNDEEGLLVWDHVRFHKTPEVMATTKDLKLLIGMVPAGCTPCCQPLDVSINKVFKHQVAEAIEQGEEQYPDNYKWTVGERRILLTQAVGIAFNWMKGKHGREIIKRSFKCTGISVSPDGSEDHLLSFKDAPNWSYENWKERGHLHEVVQLKMEAADEGVDDETINTSLMDREDLRIHFNSPGYTKKDLMMICKGREIRGTSRSKKADLIRLIIDDMIRRRENSISFPVNVDVDLDDEEVEDVSYDVDIQLDTLPEAEPEVEGWSDDGE